MGIQGMNATSTDATADADADAGDAWHPADYLPRVRRLADLSQRELAAELGVSQSTVARWEAGESHPSFELLRRALAVAGLRMVVVDAGNEPVVGFDREAVRDNAGRRFPAHLDVVPPDARPANRGLERRWDRSPARAWYSLRRTPQRAAPGGTDPGHRRPDHPSLTELAQLDNERREHRRRASLAGLVASKPLAACTCSDGCWEEPSCPPTCPCQCEAR
jgi:HTH-type transcriptional regulator/antitoxin HipB